MATAPSSGVALPTEYMALVRDTFSVRKYQDFRVVLRLHDNNRLSLRGLVLRMKVLLQGHKELRLGLNKYLPEGYEVNVEEMEKRPTTLQEAQALFQKIKDQLGEPFWRSFSRTVEYLLASRDIVNLCRLFSWRILEQDDLFEEFIKFLPLDMLAIRDDAPPSFQEWVGASSGGCGSGGVFPIPFEYITLVEDTFPLDKFNDFEEVLQDHNRRRLSLRGLVLRMKVLLRGHKELRLGLNKYLPEGYEVDVEEMEDPPPTLQEAEALFQKIKDQLEESQYRSFSRAFASISTDSTSRIVSTFRLFSWNLPSKDDLFEKFIKFLPPDLMEIRDGAHPSLPRTPAGGGGGGGAGPAETSLATSQSDDDSDSTTDGGGGDGGASGGAGHAETLLAKNLLWR